LRNNVPILLWHFSRYQTLIIRDAEAEQRNKARLYATARSRRQADLGFVAVGQQILDPPSIGKRLVLFSFSLTTSAPR
jgi:hypothetical protein